MSKFEALPSMREHDWRGHNGAAPFPDNANIAWVRHFIHHLAPQGMASFVVASGSISSNQSGEGTTRQALIEADLVDCMVALPGQLFYSTQIPVCLWFLAKNKAGDAKRGFLDGRQQTLFIDARRMGTPATRLEKGTRISKLNLPTTSSQIGTTPLKLPSSQPSFFKPSSRQMNVKT